MLRFPLSDVTRQRGGESAPRLSVEAARCDSGPGWPSWPLGQTQPQGGREGGWARMGGGVGREARMGESVGQRGSPTGTRVGPQVPSGPEHKFPFIAPGLEVDRRGGHPGGGLRPRIPASLHPSF